MEVFKQEKQYPYSNKLHASTPRCADICRLALVARPKSHVKAHAVNLTLTNFEWSQSD